MQEDYEEEVDRIMGKQNMITNKKKYVAITPSWRFSPKVVQEFYSHMKRCL